MDFISDIINLSEYIFWFIVVFSLIVFVHEFGLDVWTEIGSAPFADSLQREILEGKIGSELIRQNSFMKFMDIFTTSPCFGIHLI